MESSSLIFQDNIMIVEENKQIQNVTNTLEVFLNLKRLGMHEGKIQQTLVGKERKLKIFKKK